MTDLDQARTQEQTARIRGLNDQLRISHTGGTLVTTPGVLALGIYLNQAILIAIAAYDDFDEDNDPFGEHDFGLVEIASQEILFKSTTTTTISASIHPIQQIRWLHAGS